MTDWLAWGFVVMAGTLVTLGTMLRELSRAPRGEAPDLTASRWAFRATVVASLGVYALYVIYGEGWLWYI